jgi:hypothetical protein
MKTRFALKFSLGLMLSLLPFVVGCCGQPSDAPQRITSATNGELAVAPVTDASLVVTEQVTTQIATAAPNQPAAPESVAPPADKPLPPNIRPSSPVAEIVKLTQAGVDEGVMLADVANSTSTFNLGPAEIIYLNDLGVSDSVITAMIQRDQALKAYWSNTGQTSAASAAQTQTALAYENPPPAESQPTESFQEPSQPGDVPYFYDSLSPYGNWVELEGYGWCWQPTVVVVNPGWQPYCDRGHWVYTDCGWYWLSDYSWGWAPFHYGRWFRHQRFGWCWLPDAVWATAWVSWRYNNDYCGWAPLPPAAYYRPGFGFAFHGSAVGIGSSFGLGVDCYIFVGWNHFWDHRLNRYVLPSHRVTQIFNNTTVINNFVQGNKNTITNRGISQERVSSFTKTEIRPVALHEINGTNTREGRAERLDRDGRTLNIQRLHFAAAADADGRGGYGRRQNFSGGAANATHLGAQISSRATPATAQTVGQPQPAPSSISNSPHVPSRSDYSDHIMRGRDYGNASTASPLIIRGPDRGNQPTAIATTPAHAAQNYSWQQPARPALSQAVTPSPRVQAPVPQFQQQNVPRITRGIEDRVAAPLSGPAPTWRQTPPPAISYSTLVARQTERPQYSPPPAMPRSAPAPAYTPPPLPRALSAPAPAPSVPSRSDSGRQNFGQDWRTK